eukprot:3119296-Prymnesium_polylepis.2
MDELLLVFPPTEGASEAQAPVYAHMNKLIEEEGKAYEIVRNAHKLEMARRGATYVEWSDDDDF